MYTAPPASAFSTSTKVTITATSITNPEITSSVQITVSPFLVVLQPGLFQTNASLTLNEGDQLFINTSVLNDNSTNGVTWSLSPAIGAGSLVAPQPFLVEYVAPSTVSSPTTATVTATSVTSPTSTASLEITVFPSGAGVNVSALHVDGGPVPGQTHVNGAFTSVTVCKPGSTTACQTVDGVLVDTGSSGLRILQSQLPLVSLPTLNDGNGNIFENCDLFPDGSYLWGPVSLADVYISGEIAPSAHIQVISSSSTLPPSSCSNGGTINDNTPQLLGANGILGVGLEPTDCTLAGINYCDGSFQPSPPNIYYKCPRAGCALTDSSIIAARGQQVTNPVSLFGSDGNGVILDLPAVVGAQSSVTGRLIFGIGTESNNGIGNATVLTLDSNDHFTTVFNGQSLTSSTIDSRSDGLFFPDSLPTWRMPVNS